ncbi:helix-turn-helix domain-containing protein [Clostridium cochlearium]|uniref:helix-turn-helix domain-containing protein n=1 Tax=Clostridium cochlearium TaxID=1494 RepID=UPI00241DE0E6|nr:helix-turn-helix transcriptional regulator [Clostridium cochlearium]MBE6064702.1 helix-turn-helix transcriptional regulator [Clostridium cochlearium]
MNIGEKIKEIRKSNKLTQAQLAKQINKSERMLQKYENGEVTPSFEIIEVIAAALGVKPYELMDFEELKKEVTTIEETEKLLNILGYDVKYHNLDDEHYEIEINSKDINMTISEQKYNQLKESIKFILDYELYKLSRK